MHALGKELAPRKGKRQPGLPAFMELAGMELYAVELAMQVLEGPTQQMEFVARRLLTGRTADNKRSIVLGTPLYVALSDR